MKKILSKGFVYPLIIVCVLIGLLFVSCEEKVNYEEILTEALNTIELPTVLENNIDFPESVNIKEKEVTFAFTTNNDALTSSGIVTRAEVDIQVSVSCVASCDGNTKNKDLGVITVKALEAEKNNDEVFESAFNQITLPEEVTENISLPSVITVDGKELTAKFTFSKDIITTEGIVTRQEEDTLVDVYCELVFEGETKTEKVGTILVLGSPVNYNTLKVSLEESVYLVGGFYYLNLENDKGQLDPEQYLWETDNPDIAIVDEYAFFCPLKKGTVTITVRSTTTNDYGEITLDIINRIPVLVLSTSAIIVGDEFTIRVNNYDDLSLLEVEVEGNFIKDLGNNKFQAENVGVAKVTYRVKDDPSTYASVDVSVYSVKPVLQIRSTELTVGTSSRCDVLNYADESMYVFEITGQEIISINNRIITALMPGETTIKVSLTSDPEIYETLVLTVVPIKPEFQVAASNLIVGVDSYFIIKNINDLESQNYDDYIITNPRPDILSVEGRVIKPLTVGEVTLKITLKSNEKVTNEYNVIISELSSEIGTDGEIGAGGLVLSLEGNPITVKIGEMIKVNIAGSVKSENYKWMVDVSNVLSALDSGYVIGVTEGIATLTIANVLDPSITGKIVIEIQGIEKVDLVSRLIKVAEGELGYRELPNLQSKYGIWYGIPDGHWCAMFVTWCAYYSGISTDIIPHYCNCTAGSQWFIERDSFGYKGEYTPKAGDIIFFLSQGASHTGIVTGCSGDTVYTIEGNTSNMVARRQYSLSYGQITGYGIPNYPSYE